MSRERVQQLLEQMEYAYEQEGWFVPVAGGLADLPAAQAAWCPGPGIHTIWQIVSHLSFWKEVYGRRLQGAPRTGEQIDNDATFGPPGDAADAAGWQAAVARLHAAHAVLRAELQRREDADLDRPLPGDREPVGGAFNGMIGHDAYHGGQILLLRKLQGSWPARR